MRPLIVHLMTKEPGKHRDRYDVTGNMEAEYVDVDQTVLVNKSGITDLHELQLREEECLVHAYETLLDEIRTDTPLTVELIRYVHHRIFGELYDWAGHAHGEYQQAGGDLASSGVILDQNMAQWEQNFLAKYPAAAPRR